MTAGEQSHSLSLFTKMDLLHLFTLLVLINSGRATIISREGFKVERKQWTNVIGKALEDAKDAILMELPDARFVVHPSDFYENIPEEGYLNKVILGVSPDGTVTMPAKYFGYVPDLEFARTLIGLTYQDAIETIKNRLPSCQISVLQDDRVIHNCCENHFMDYLSLKVDEDGLVRELPVFIVTY